MEGRVCRSRRTVVGKGETVTPVGPDGDSMELFKIPLEGDLALRRRLLHIVVYVWRGGGAAAVVVERCHHHGTPQKEGSDRIQQLQGISRSLVAHAGKMLLKIVARHLSE